MQDDDAVVRKKIETIIADERVVPEFLQDDLEPDRVGAALIELIDPGSDVRAQLREFFEVDRRWITVAALKALALPSSVTIVGIILLTAFVNLFVGSASGKWGLLAPIFVPMLMSLGISPDLTQAAYRVGDSSTNIITPLMPYFPLVVVYCQRYVKSTGIGTLTAMMLPYSMWFLLTWTIFLLIYFFIGIPLGFGSSYTYPPS